MLAQLDTKTVYTFMDSMVTIENYVGKAKELGYHALGIMDKTVFMQPIVLWNPVTKWGFNQLLVVNWTGNYRRGAGHHYSIDCSDNQRLSQSIENFDC